MHEGLLLPLILYGALYAGALIVTLVGFSIVGGWIIVGWLLRLVWMVVSSLIFGVTWLLNRRAAMEAWRRR